MARSQMIRMECDYCGDAEVFDITSGDQRVMIPRLQKWIGVVSALAPAGPNAPDTTKWYDSAECVGRGLRKDAETAQLEKAVEVASA